MLDEDYYRELEIVKLEEGEMIDGIAMLTLPQAGGYIFLDDAWDEDGDSIQAQVTKLFRTDGDPLVQATFAQGADPRYVARVLRKYAEMLEGPQGFAIANMASTPGNVDHTIRLEDGTVTVFNRREEYERWKRESEDDEDNDNYPTTNM